VLPCFVVQLARSAVPRPLLPGLGVPREIDLRYSRMLQGHDARSAASDRLLQVLMQMPCLVAFIEAGEVAAKQRRHAHNAGKLSARAASHVKSATSVIMGTAIGSGMFGTVFRAKWQGFDVAVKQLNQFDANSVAALKKEGL
jgi:hypothetical protein